MTDGYGTLTTTEDLPRVKFERVLEAAVDAVWAMLATDDGLERWLAPASVELRVGGTIDLDFGEGEVVGGEIIELDYGRTLEYHWRFTGEPDSIIRFELEPAGESKTRLTLDHRLLPTDQAVGYSAGWHAHLDQMEDALAGGSGFDWMARFSELMPKYQPS